MEQKRYEQKLNNESSNRGAALVSIIIVMAVVSILGLLSLSVSYDNFRMKNVDKNASENFYGAEKALEEVAAGLQGIASECYTRAYTEVMADYASFDTATEMQMKYEELFLAELTAEMKEPGSFSRYNTDLIKSYIEDENASFRVNDGVDIAEGVTGDDTDKNYLNTADGGLYLRNIGIMYEEEGYADEIVTDILISAPAVTFEKIANAPSVVDYALIANDGMYVQGYLNVTGKAFAGLPEAEENILGIEEEVETVSISLQPGAAIIAENEKDTEVICEGDVELTSSASFTTNANTTLWASGVTTSVAGSVRESVEKTNTVSLLGTTYMKDDTTINGEKNTLKLGGQYYGYSGSSTDAKESSAIIINGINTSLDMSQLNTLVLAGTSFVGTKGEAFDTLQSQYPELADAVNADVLIGDSVAVKTNQLAYMVPTECDGIESNPMTYEQYKKLIGTDNWERKVLSTYISGLGRSIASYGDVIITPVFTNRMGGAVYLYLEFANTDAASQFFMDNYGRSASGKKVQESLQNYISAFQFGSIGRIHTAGNYLVQDTQGRVAYEAAAGGLKEMNLADSFAKKCGEMKFDQLIDENIVEQMVKGERNKVFQGEVTVTEDGQTKKVQLIVVDNNSENDDPYIVNQDFYGVLIATGDVQVVGSNMSVEGLILCGGKLQVQSTEVEGAVNLQILADGTIATQALRIENEDGVSGMNLFKVYGGGFEETSEDGSSESKKVDIRDCVTFENWKTR